MVTTSREAQDILCYKSLLSGAAEYANKVFLNIYVCHYEKHLT